MIYERHNGGWIEVICGCMFSGKSEELIRRVKRAHIARQNVQTFHHAIDVRYGEGQIASHSGLQATAQPSRSASEILAMVRPETEVVAIDEVQFYDESIADVADQLADEGKRVITAGLDMDFRAVPFGGMPALMARAEVVTKLHAICVVCGAPASRTQRLVNDMPAYYDDPVIMVGAAEAYEARCRRCHEVPRRG